MSVDGGHYVNLCQDPNTLEWHRYDDNNVKPLANVVKPTGNESL